jgi:hypothetical protein
MVWKRGLMNYCHQPIIVHETGATVLNEIPHSLGAIVLNCFLDTT